MATARLQRWAIILSGHTYDIVYRKGPKLGHADALSRLPITDTTGHHDGNSDIFHFSIVNELSFKAKDIAMSTQRDPTLARMYEMTMKGWSKTRGKGGGTAGMNYQLSKDASSGNESSYPKSVPRANPGWPS